MKNSMITTAVIAALSLATGLMPHSVHASPVDPGVQSSVSSFAAKWFHSFDTNAPVEEFLIRLEDQGLEMKFPEATLRSHADFRQFYAGIQREIRQASHEILSVTVTTVQGEEITAKVRVIWRADKFSGEHVEFHAAQTWVLTQIGGILKLKGYLVQEDVVQAPALASSLTCVCYGGPGMYRFPCAPVTKTCYGGPGYYPYNCLVCPQ